MSDAMMVFLCVLIFFNGAFFGYVFGSRTRYRAPAPSPMTAAEEEKLRQEREELKAEQEAFLGMMGYNADIAYGVNEDPFGGKS